MRHPAGKGWLDATVRLLLVVLTEDGGTVAFDSYATNLDPRDTDGYLDVYVKDLTTGEVTVVAISDLGQKGNGQTFHAAISADARWVAFETFATNLHPCDHDALGDILVKMF